MERVAEFMLLILLRETVDFLTEIASNAEAVEEFIDR